MDLPCCERIVALVTPDRSGAGALAWIGSLRRAIDAELIVVRSAVNPSAEHDPDVEAEFIEERDAETDAWLSEHGLVAEEVVSVDDPDPGTAIVEIARPGDLVVVGLGSHPVRSIAPDHVAATLVRDVPCPVVVVPEGDVPNHGGPILVAIDGSESNYGVVEFGRAFAASVDRPLEAVYATDPMYDTFDNADDDGLEERRAREEAHAEFVQVHERSGDVVDVLVELAVDTDAFLTIVGHGHHPLTEHIDVLHPVRRLLHHPPTPFAVVPEVVAERFRGDEIEQHHGGGPGLRLTADELAALRDARRVLALTDDGTEPELAIERTAAARVAGALHAQLVLVDRSHETWAETPHVDGPATLDQVRARGDDELAAQMARALELGAPDVVAVTPSVPNFDAIVDSIELADADVIVVPDRLDHPRLAERWHHHGDIALTVKERAPGRRVVAVHDDDTMRLV
jgi:nucleotide-binding universal stress UspA family protein